MKENEIVNAMGKIEQTIAILSYNVRHRKTYDVLCLLKAKGYTNVTVYAKAFHYKKKYSPILEHRPPVYSDMLDTETICHNFNYKYVEITEYDDSITEKIVLMCGAGIIPDEFVRKHIIINAHPGYVPNCRGLDAYKWAIYENQPIGVTTHIIGKHVDAGEVIERRVITINRTDTFYYVAQKVYDNEITMLVNAIDKVEETHLYIDPNGYPVHKRMPHEKELDLLELFEMRKESKNENISFDRK